MKPVADLYEPMREYFQTISKNAKDRTFKRSEKEIASLAGLSIKLGISKAQLTAMQFGTEEERQFYGDMMAEFEVCAAVMHAASMIDGPMYKKLCDMFEEKGSESDRVLVLNFSDFKAPDDWEDYKELKAACDELGIGWKQAIKVLRRSAQEKAV